MNRSMPKILAIVGAVLLAVGVWAPFYRMSAGVPADAPPGTVAAPNWSLADVGPVSEYFLAKVCMFGAVFLVAILLVSVFTTPRPLAVWTGVLASVSSVLLLVASLVVSETLAADDLAHNFGFAELFYILGCLTVLFGGVLAVRSSDDVHGPIGDEAHAY
jgi:hypothetical protein